MEGAALGDPFLDSAAAAGVSALARGRRCPEARF